MDAGPAIGGLDPEAGAIGIADGIRIALRKQGGDQVHGGIDQQTGRLTVGCLQNVAAGRRSSAGVDTGCDQGGRRGDHRMAVGAAEQDDPAGRSGVEIIPGQETGLGPAGLDPASPDDGTLRVRRGPGRQPGHGVGDRG